MDQVYEAIERIPEQFRYVIVIAVAILLVALYYFLLRLPAQDDLARVRTEYEQVHTTYLEKKQIADNLQYWQLEVQRLRSRLEDALTRLPKTVDTEELLIDIPNIAKKNALTVQAFDVQSERSKQGYAEVPMQLKMTGTYQGVGGFAQEVGMQPRIMAVTALDLQRTGKKKGGGDGDETAEEDEGVELSIDAEVVTYRFLEQGGGGGGQKKGRGRGGRRR